jgi:hypothetical protein
VSAGDVGGRLAPLRGLVDAVLERFPALEYLTPNGVLVVPVDVGPVTQVRIELPRQFLHVQSVGLTAQDGTDATVGASVSVSSWYGTYEERFSASALFDWDHPSGTVVHTEQDSPSRLVIRLPKPVQLSQIRLRNVAGRNGPRAALLRIRVHTRWRRHLVFDGGALHREIRAAVASYDLGPFDAVTQALRPILVDILKGDYRAARRALDRADLAPEVLSDFRTVVNADLLPSRELLWTIHGPHRAFRFWSEAEQLAYVEFAVEVVDALRDLTPHVCFGFGAVLSVVRDGALIPHDDDLDVIIGFEPHEAATLADGLALVTLALQARGLSVRGSYIAHRQVGRHHRGKHVDVFVGLFEGDAISWYPGTRGALKRTTMYPTTTAPLLGVLCPLPARPEAYLATLYGEHWRTPDPNFAHRWDRAAYADLEGVAEATSRPGPGSLPTQTPTS